MKNKKSNTVVGPHYKCVLTAKNNKGVLETVEKIVPIKIEDLVVPTSVIDNVLCSDSCIDVVDIEPRGSKRNIVDTTGKALFKQITGNVSLYWSMACKYSAKLVITDTEVASVVTASLERADARVSESMARVKQQLDDLWTTQVRIGKTLKLWKKFSKTNKLKTKKVK